MTTPDWPTAFAAALREVDPDVDAERAEAAMRWALDNVPRPRQAVDDSGFEAPGADWGRCVDDDQMADVLEARETAWREGLR